MCTRLACWQAAVESFRFATFLRFRSFLIELDLTTHLTPHCYGMLAHVTDVHACKKQNVSRWNQGGLLCAQAAEQIIVLDSGRVVEVGTHEELVRRGGQYEKLVSTQSLSLSNS